MNASSARTKRLPLRTRAKPTSLTAHGAAGGSAQPRLAILTNLVAPYRVPLYERIAEGFAATVLVSGKEANRRQWEGEEPQLRGLTIRRSGGLSIAYRSGRGQVYDHRFLHFPLGQLIDLLWLRPDAVIASEMGLRTVLALAYGSLFRKPVWIGWGGTLHTERRTGAVRRAVRRLLARWGRRWISYGRSSTEYLRALGIPRERILQMQNCVDESLYRRPTPPALTLRPRPVFLFVGQMILRKGVDRFLEAAAVLQREGYEFSLLLVGDGPELPAFQALGARLMLRNITFQPAQRPTVMPAFYRSADFLVFPTFEDVWGLVVNEALWSGVPVLSSRYAGCAAELLPASQLFDPHDLDDLVRVMRLALEGRVPPPDTGPLKPCAEVGRMINSEIQRVLERQAR